MGAPESRRVAQLNTSERERRLHPPNHGSFASQVPGKKPGDVIELNGLTQVLWPDHCVQRSKGAEIHPLLDTRRIVKIFQKGVDPEIDSYSGFFDNGHRRGTGLAEYLKSAGVTGVYVCGLATDYCVKYTALDARRVDRRHSTHAHQRRWLQADSCAVPARANAVCERGAVSWVRGAGAQPDEDDDPLLCRE